MPVPHVRFQSRGGVSRIKGVVFRFFADLLECLPLWKMFAASHMNSMPLHFRLNLFTLYRNSVLFWSLWVIFSSSDQWPWIPSRRLSEKRRKRWAVLRPMRPIPASFFNPVRIVAVVGEDFPRNILPCSRSAACRPMGCRWPRGRRSVGRGPMSTI